MAVIPFVALLFWASTCKFSIVVATYSTMHCHRDWDRIYGNTITVHIKLLNMQRKFTPASHILMIRLLLFVLNYDWEGKTRMVNPLQTEHGYLIMWYCYLGTDKSLNHLR
jgi:hypothetical protein